MNFQIDWKGWVVSSLFANKPRIRAARKYVGEGWHWYATCGNICIASADSFAIVANKVKALQASAGVKDYA